MADIRKRIPRLQTQVSNFTSIVQRDRGFEQSLRTQISTLQSRISTAPANQRSFLTSKLRSLQKNRGKVTDRRQKFERRLSVAQRDLSRAQRGQVAADKIPKLQKGSKIIPIRLLSAKDKQKFKITRDTTGRVIGASSAVLRAQPGIVGERISDRQRDFIIGGLAGTLTATSAKRRIGIERIVAKTKINALARVNKSISEGNVPTAGDVFLAQFGFPRADLTKGQLQSSKNFITKIQGAAKEQRKVMVAARAVKVSGKIQELILRGVKKEPLAKQTALEKFAGIIIKADRRLEAITEKELARAKSRSASRLSVADNIYKSIGIPAPIRAIYRNTPDGIKFAEDSFIGAKQMFKQFTGQIPTKAAFLLASAHVSVAQGNFKNALTFMNAIILGDNQSRNFAASNIVEAVKSPETYIFALLGRPGNIYKIPAPRLIKNFRIKLNFVTKLPRAGTVVKPNSLFFDRRTQMVRISDASGVVTNLGNVSSLSKTARSKISTGVRKAKVRQVDINKKIADTKKANQFLKDIDLDPAILKSKLPLAKIKKQIILLRNIGIEFRLKTIEAQRLGFKNVSEFRKYQNTTSNKVASKIADRVSRRVRARILIESKLEFGKKTAASAKRRLTVAERNALKAKEAEVSVQIKVERGLERIRAASAKELARLNKEAVNRGFKDAAEFARFQRDSALARNGDILANIRLKLLDRKIASRKTTAARKAKAAVKKAIIDADEVFIVRRKSRIDIETKSQLKKLRAVALKRARSIAPIEVTLIGKQQAVAKIKSDGFQNLKEYKRYYRAVDRAFNGDRSALSIVRKIDIRRKSKLGRKKGKEFLKSLEITIEKPKELIVIRGNQKAVVKGGKIEVFKKIKKPVRVSKNQYSIQEVEVKVLSKKIKKPQTKKSATKVINQAPINILRAKKKLFSTPASLFAKLSKVAGLKSALFGSLVLERRLVQIQDLGLTPFLDISLKPGLELELVPVYKSILVAELTKALKKIQLPKLRKALKSATQLRKRPLRTIKRRAKRKPRKKPPVRIPTPEDEERDPKLGSRQGYNVFIFKPKQEKWVRGNKVALKITTANALKRTLLDNSIQATGIVRLAKGAFKKPQTRILKVPKKKFRKPKKGSRFPKDASIEKRRNRADKPGEKIKLSVERAIAKLRRDFKTKKLKR